ncbi:MAG: magnesium transporter [Armatimonadota bacterium]|nr:magnesium transporter [Armatimonadota bacterium]
MESQEKNPLEDLEALAEAERYQEAADLLTEQHSQDAADALQALDAHQVAAILVLVNPDRAADILEDLPDDFAGDILEEIQPRQAAKIVTHITSDEEADILQELTDTQQDAIIRHLDREQADIAREMLAYEEDSAGGLMQKEFIAIDDSLTATEARKTLQQMAENETDFYPFSYIYATNDGRFAGVLGLRALLFAQPNTPVRNLITEATQLSPETPADEILKLFRRTDLLSLPVVDQSGKLLGIVTQEDAQQFEQEESAEEFLRFTGIVGGEEVRDMPLRQRAGRRLLWLVIKMALNVIPASVVAAYTKTPAFLALAPILPIISDMGGSGGSQAIAVTIRELAQNRIKTADYAWVMAKEVGVGVVNGLILGALLGLGTWVATQGDASSLTIGLIVAAATVANMILAVVFGGLMPIALRRMKVDPAVASGPILTMATDTCGFFFVLALASLLIR